MELYFESYEFSNFRDFFGIFLNFYGFILNLFLFKNIKIGFYIHVDLADNVASAYMSKHDDVCARHVAQVRASLPHVISG